MRNSGIDKPDVRHYNDFSMNKDLQDLLEQSIKDLKLTEEQADLQECFLKIAFINGRVEALEEQLAKK